MTTQLWLYEHEDGRIIVAVPGAAILAGDPQWVRVGPVEVQGVNADTQSLFAEALAWGKVYGEALPASQWDEMRDEMASRFAARLASTKKDAVS